MNQGVPRILLLSSRHYLMSELVAGCLVLGLTHQYVFLGNVQSAAELEALVRAEIAALRPDFVLTLNHLGLDHEGIVSSVCQEHDLPILSWFVDHPGLFLAEYSDPVLPHLAYAVWDADAIPQLLVLGAAHVFHLPLGADIGRLQAGRTDRLQREVAFVGNSMQAAIEKSWSKTGLEERRRETWTEIAKGFAWDKSRDTEVYLAECADSVRAEYLCQEKAERTALHAFLYWQATQEYRTACVRELLPFNPVVAGDTYWKELLGKASWQYVKALNYYRDLPSFYRSTAINFNTTSMQMKGALNQRFFDVPASGGFLLSDYRDQLDDAFEIGKEVVCYGSIEEISDLVRFYLNHPAERQAVIARGRERVEKQHSYAHRLRQICAQMHAYFGTPC